MELTKLPTEIICEIAGFLDINDIKHLEIILEIKFPHYIFAPKYKKLFTQSINEIDDLRYCINYLRGKESARYHKKYLTDIESTYAVEYHEYITSDLQKKYLVRMRRGEGYRPSVSYINIVDINPTSVPRIVQIKACTKEIDGLKNHYFKIY